VVVITGAVTGLAVLAWALSVFNAGGRASAAAELPPGIALGIPVVVLVMIGVVTWLLLTGTGEHDEEGEAYVDCGTCSRSILREWRLCPYCGSRVEQRPLDEGSGHSAS
jgi:hypothetical protein